MKEEIMKIIYCKKQISNRDWEDNYMNNPMYLPLSVPKEQGKWIAFSRVDNGKPLPLDLVPLNDDEIRQLDNHRKSNNVYPECMQTIDNLACQKLSNCKSLEELKEVWENLNVATKLADIIKERKNELKLKFQSLGI